LTFAAVRLRDLLPNAAPTDVAVFDSSRVLRASGFAGLNLLEQISDWLTKILVGVGLVQFTTLAQHAGELVEFLGPPLGGDPLGESFAAATLVVFGISGFLAFYLVTRIYLPLAFAYTDRKARDLSAYKKVRVAIGADAVKKAEFQVTGKQADDKQVLTTVEGLTEITATKGPHRFCGSTTRQKATVGARPHDDDGHDRDDLSLDR
jgi:hypothetical protein